MKIETWYDLECSKCGLHFSTDFKHGMYYNKEELKRIAKEEGWTYKNKLNICPVCNSREHNMK